MLIRRVLVTLGAIGLSTPALAQGVGSSNPFRVTWDIDAPSMIDPLPLALGDRADFEIGRARLPSRLPLRVMLFDPANPPPSAADDGWIVPDPWPAPWFGAWSETTRFQACGAADPACADRLPGAFGLRLRSDGAGGVKLGALVRLGERLTMPRTTSRNAWRFFFAADAHAVTWDFNHDDDESFRLEDHIMLGDAQVGVARPLAGGDLSLGLTQREVKTQLGRDSISRVEQFGGVTFTMRH